MSKIHTIFLLAPNIPQLYVAIAFIKKLKKHIPNSEFIISSRDKYHNFIAGDTDIRIVGLFPDFKKQINEEELTSIIFIGHSYFLEKETLQWATHNTVSTFWINAHFEKADLINWAQDKIYAEKLVHTFNSIFYENTNDLILLKQIGFELDQLHLVENAKYDCAFPFKNQVRKTKKIIQTIGATHKRIIVAGSVTDGLENQLLLNAFDKLHKKFPDILLILTPRSMDHIPFFINEIATITEHFSKTSDLDAASEQTHILLVDQMGLLKGFYHWASIAFIGRTLVEKSGGGSNILEPASQSIPIITGPYMNGYTSILTTFIEEDAILQLSKSSELLEAFTLLLTNQDRSDILGKNAFGIINKYAGGLHKTAHLIYNNCLAQHL